MNLNKSVFRDPENGDALAAFTDEGFVTSGGKIFPIVREIPRFVSSENYAAAFGAQWNMFPKTQLDSNSGVSVSEDRLSRCRATWNPSRVRKCLKPGAGPAASVKSC
jgi:hypothetical protein